jgi:DNA-binding transcriptional LysR family regulator
LELRHLRYLIAVSEESGFVKAAERLRVAQPALSRQIRALEHEVGADAFIRGRRGISLTTAGAMCVQAARSILLRVDVAIERARLAEVGRSGSCSIYVSPWATHSGFSAKLVSWLRTTEPGIRIQLEETGGAHWDGVRSGLVDIAISTMPPPGLAELAAAPLIRDIVDTAILAANHPLAGRKSISITEILDEPLVVHQMKEIYYVSSEIDDAFARAGGVPAIRKHAPSSEALMAMVTAGLGWSIHRRSLRGKIPGVAMVHVKKLSIPFPVALVWRRGELSPAALTVMRRIRELAAREYPSMYAPDPRVPAARRQSRRASQPSAVELRDFRYFVAAVEEPSIGRAAARLGISQPALSRQLKDLERDVGVPLLTRTHLGAKPTRAGRTFYDDCVDILDEASRLVSEVARGERAISGQCNMAAVPSSEVRELVGRVISVAAMRYPDIAFHIQNIPTPHQPEEIRNGRFDLGICHPFPGLVANYPEVDCEELMSDVIDSALVAADHPLAAKSEIDISELRAVPFLFFRRDFHPAFHDYLMDAFRAAGFEHKPGAMQEGLQTMWALTAAGEGWSLGFGRQRTLPPAGVVAVPIRGFSIPWGVVLLTRRNEKRPATLTMIELVRAAVRNN